MLVKTSVFLFLAIFLGAEGLSCPSGFKLVNQNKCLRIFTNKLKHTNAETDCKYLGGTLVTVKDWNENSAIMNLAASTGINSVWLGMFCFITGSSITCYHDDTTGVLKFTNFANGNPAVTGNGGCVYMQVSGDSAGQWVSAPCDLIAMPFICEVPMTNPDASCAHNYNGYCYMASHEMNLSTVNTYYDRAQAICLSNNANLVSLHSKPEIDYVKSIYRNTGVQQIFAGAKAFLPDTFEWSDGSNWDYDYTDPLATSKGDCLVMDLSSRPNNGMWSEIDCRENYHFLCKRKAGEHKKEETIKETLKPFNRNLKIDTSYLTRNFGVNTYGSPCITPTLCTYNLAALGPYRMGIYFTDFSTWGNVQIYDEFGNLIFNSWGNQNPFQVLGPTNVMKINHDSHGQTDHGYHGFSATILPF